ncbi:unnamed protein product [Caenorhabditis auriculariae]|uniref:SANT domain-containing protein n=1 Tax=Caenorhabditis auriculariae TaxID=2777116 RepID=A0A8S1GX89_9PELO|nr:unnamed protein product [Caenorhabditis auriculariae]
MSCLIDSPEGEDDIVKDRSATRENLFKRKNALNYMKAHREWLKKIERFEVNTKKSTRAPELRDLVEKLFPEVKKDREDEERIARGERLRGEDLQNVNSKAEQREKWRRGVVLPPDMLTPEERLADVFEERPGSTIEDMAAVQRKMLQENEESWTEGEEELFTSRLQEFGKNFAALTLYFDNKNCKDCVLHYYMTKKERKYKLCFNKRKKPRVYRMTYKAPQMPTEEEVAKFKNFMKSKSYLSTSEKQFGSMCFVCCEQLHPTSNPGCLLPNNSYETFAISSSRQREYCLKCKSEAWRLRNSSKCHVPNCVAAKRKMRPTKSLPTKLRELSLQQRAFIFDQMEVPRATLKFCGPCHKRFLKKIEQLLSGELDEEFEKFLGHALWPEAENMKLKQLVEEHGAENWDLILEKMGPGKTLEECRQQFDMIIAKETSSSVVGPSSSKAFEKEDEMDVDDGNGAMDDDIMEIDVPMSNRKPSSLLESMKSPHRTSSISTRLPPELCSGPFTVSNRTVENSPEPSVMSVDDQDDEHLSSPGEASNSLDNAPSSGHSRPCSYPVASPPSNSVAEPLTGVLNASREREELYRIIFSNGFKNYFHSLSEPLRKTKDTLIRTYQVPPATYEEVLDRLFRLPSMQNHLISLARFYKDLVSSNKDEIQMEQIKQQANLLVSSVDLSYLESNLTISYFWMKYRNELAKVEQEILTLQGQINIKISEAEVLNKRKKEVEKAFTNTFRSNLVGSNKDKVVKHDYHQIESELNSVEKVIKELQNKKDDFLTGKLKCELNIAEIERGMETPLDELLVFSQEAKLIPTVSGLSINKQTTLDASLRQSEVTTSRTEVPPAALPLYEHQATSNVVQLLTPSTPPSSKPPTPPVSKSATPPAFAPHMTSSTSSTAPSLLLQRPIPQVAVVQQRPSMLQQKNLIGIRQPDPRSSQISNGGVNVSISNPLMSLAQKQMAHRRMQETPDLTGESRTKRKSGIETISGLAQATPSRPQLVPQQRRGASPATIHQQLAQTAANFPRIPLAAGRSIVTGTAGVGRSLLLPSTSAVNSTTTQRHALSSSATSFSPFGHAASATPIGMNVQQHLLQQFQQSTSYPRAPSSDNQLNTASPRAPPIAIQYPLAATTSNTAASVIGLNNSFLMGQTQAVRQTQALSTLPATTETIRMVVSSHVPGIADQQTPNSNDSYSDLSDDGENDETQAEAYAAKLRNLPVGNFSLLDFPDELWIPKTQALKAVTSSSRLNGFDVVSFTSSHVPSINNPIQVLNPNFAEEMSDDD